MHQKHVPVDLTGHELFALDVHVWGGKTRLYKADLTDGGDTLPPDTLASLGTLRIVDPKAIAEQSALKRRAERACLRWGSRFLGGYLQNKERTAELVKELDGLKAKFDRVTADMVTQREALIEAWAEQNPEWGALIRQAAPRAIARARDPYFRYTPIVIGAAVSHPEALAEAAEMIGSQVLREIAQDAKAAYEKSFAGKADCTRKALSPLVRMREKLYAMRFVSADAVDVIFDIDQVLGALPKTGPIEKGAFDSLVALTLRLMHGDVRKGAESPYTNQRGLQALPEALLEETDEAAEPQLEMPLADEDRLPTPPRPVIPPLAIERVRRPIWF